jgi:hypothetical protein
MNRTDTIRDLIKTQDLNRPDEDDMFTDPGDYYTAINQAVRKARQKVAAIDPQSLLQVDTVTSSDDGETFDLADVSGVTTGDHYGELEVWTPPGPPDGYQLGETYPGSGIEGYYFQGNVLHLTYPKDYDPGLYVRWIPRDFTEADADNNPDIPALFDDYLRYQAAAELADRPGVAVESQRLREKARIEWRGDPNDPSDAGLLSTLRRSSSTSGSAHLNEYPAPWWSGIRSAP